MKSVHKLVGHFLIRTEEGIGVLILALVAAIGSGGLVAAALWMAHGPSASIAPDAANGSCLKRCEKACGSTIHLP
jgi:hypothetical protein